MKTSGLLTLALLAGAVGADGDDASVTLHYGAAHQLTDKGKAEIRSLALAFLESSNFNSAQHRDILKATTKGVHAAYRKTVGGRYLVISFETPRRVKTIGGEVEVLEAVIGLNGPEYANSLFTIDAEGRVTSHEKYSGAVGIELLQAVKKLPPEG